MTDAQIEPTMHITIKKDHPAKIIAGLSSSNLSMYKPEYAIIEVVTNIVHLLYACVNPWNK